MSFLHTSDLAEASSFRRRIAPCVAKVAGIVYSEEPSGKFNVDRKRRDLAGECLRDPVKNSDQFVWAVLSNPQIATSGLAASDGDLEYVINATWSAIAGVTAIDENDEELV